MTIQEKFKQWFINDEEDEHYEGMVKTVAIEHEKIADDYAIGFAKWSRENHIKYTVLGNVDSYKELLEIYKKSL